MSRAKFLPLAEAQALAAELAAIRIEVARLEALAARTRR
jgi:hypothetical protein